MVEKKELTNDGYLYSKRVTYARDSYAAQVYFSWPTAEITASNSAAFCIHAAS